MGLFALIATGTLGYCQSGSADKTRVVSPKEFPIPEGARELEIDEHKQEIRFQTETPIDATAKFFQARMKELDWTPTFEQVASIFANLYYKKDGKNIKIRVKKKNIFKPTVSVTILGDGLAWKGGPAAGDAPKRRERTKSTEQPVAQRKPEKTSPAKVVIGIRGFDFPLLDTQQADRDGSLELITFRSRKSVAANLAYFDKVLADKGFRQSQAKKYGDVQTARYEKQDDYIRVGLWPHAFSDHTGSHQGAKGAVEGTGVIWSDSEPSGNVLERQVRHAERFFGKFSEERRNAAMMVLHLKRESAFWPEGEMPDWARVPGRGPDGHHGANVSQPTEDATAKPADTVKASITVNKKLYNLKYGIAFHGHWFDEKVPMVLFCEKQISVQKLRAAVSGGFDSQELYFLEQDRYLLLRCASADSPTVSGGMDNLSISSSNDVAAEIKVAGKRIAGKVSTTKPESSGPFTFNYKMEFALPITAFD